MNIIFAIQNWGKLPKPIKKAGKGDYSNFDMPALSFGIFLPPFFRGAHSSKGRKTSFHYSHRTNKEHRKVRMEQCNIYMYIYIYGTKLIFICVLIRYTLFSITTVVS